MMLEIIRTIDDLRKKVSDFRKVGERIGLIPTMGALHAGHLSLVAQAKKETDRQIVTIFVNPKQFGKNEDFSAYPRHEAEDAAKLQNVDVLFAPNAEEIYPPGFATKVEVGELANELCGPHRPGHFSGVATIVTKLLTQSLPDRAYFGEKDYQQLQIIKRLVKDLDIPVEIVGVSTMREHDGLAMSSRNRYLSQVERKTASRLPEILKQSAAAIKDGKPIDIVLREGLEKMKQAGFDPIDYFTLADSETLKPLNSPTRPCRLFIAAYLGRTRLIDNWPVITGK